jgi:hypothetical protein
MAAKNEATPLPPRDRESKKRKVTLLLMGDDVSESSKSIPEEEVVSLLQRQSQNKSTDCNSEAFSEQEEGEEQYGDADRDEEREQNNRREEAAASTRRLTWASPPIRSSEKGAQVNKTSNSSKPNPVIALWKKEDEEILLQAIDQYYEKHGKLPSRRSGYGALLPAVQGRLSFAPTMIQIYNKFCGFRVAYNELLTMPSESQTLIFKQNEETKQRFLMWRKWLLNETETREGKEDNSPCDYSCLCKVIDEAAKSDPLFSDLSAHSNSVDLIKLLGQAQARELETKLKKCKYERMKLKVEEMKLAAEAVNILVKKMG